jgi:hypothetical protein
VVIRAAKRGERDPRVAAKGRIEVGPRGVKGEGSVRAFAGAKSEQSAPAIDQMIKSSVENAVRSATSVTKIIATVRNGKVTKLDGLPDAKDIKKRSQVQSKRTGGGAVRGAEVQVD